MPGTFGQSFRLRGIFDLDLKPQVQFGRTGFYNGPISRYHDIVIDDEGSIYVGDILGNKVQKFRLRKSE